MWYANSFSPSSLRLHNTWFPAHEREIIEEQNKASEEVYVLCSFFGWFSLTFCSRFSISVRIIALCSNVSILQFPKKSNTIQSVLIDWCECDGRILKASRLVLWIEIWKNYRLLAGKFITNTNWFNRVVVVVVVIVSCWKWMEGRLRAGRDVLVLSRSVNTVRLPDEFIIDSVKFGQRYHRTEWMAGVIIHYLDVSTVNTSPGNRGDKVLLFHFCAHVYDVENWICIL